MHEDAGFVGRAFRDGAHGYLVKGAVVAELEGAVRVVARETATSARGYVPGPVR